AAARSRRPGTGRARRSDEVPWAAGELPPRLLAPIGGIWEGRMLSDYAVHPSLATANVDKARSWYAERLGLEPLLAFSGLLVYQVEQTIFTLFETSSAGTAKNTVALWRVPDLRAEIA